MFWHREQEVKKTPKRFNTTEILLSEAISKQTMSTQCNRYKAVKLLVSDHFKIQ